MKSGLLAAVEIGHLFGIDSTDPLVIQETNNTVVWLRPSPVIAKVGTWADSAEGLVLEHEVATALRCRGAPVAPPFALSVPQRHHSTGFTVTLWDRVESDPNAQVSASMIGRSLGRIHSSLAASELVLPDFHAGLNRARHALADDSLMRCLPPSDVAFLRDSYDALLGELDGRVFPLRALHGEPHDGNFLPTPSGICWIDFEGACRGPLEWDLAFLPADARKSFGDVDDDLLALLSTLNSARVATWCWIQAHFEHMRWHGEHHLAVVKANWPRRGR